MTLSDAFIVYPWGALAILALMAWIDRHTAREAFLGSLLWPIVLILIAWYVALDAMERLGFRWFFSTKQPGLNWHIRRTSGSSFGFCATTPFFLFLFFWERP